jgi:hypothetical protein
VSADANPFATSSARCSRRTSRSSSASGTTSNRPSSGCLPRSALANIADLTVNAGAWIEALRGEAERLDRRSEALRMIATGLAELEETAP